MVKNILNQRRLLILFVQLVIPDENNLGSSVINFKSYKQLKSFGSPCRIFQLCNVSSMQSREGILGHQIYKRLESFAPCYSQSLLLVDLKKTIFFSGFNNPYQKSKQETAFCRTE
jgi:hypothetical protein